MNYTPSIKYMHIQRALPLTKAKCKRCGQPFTYYRRGRHRHFCESCQEARRKDHNDFYNARARGERLAARENAIQAHAAAEASR